MPTQVRCQLSHIQEWYIHPASVIIHKAHLSHQGSEHLDLQWDPLFSL